MLLKAAATVAAIKNDEGNDAHGNRSAQIEDRTRLQIFAKFNKHDLKIMNRDQILSSFLIFYLFLGNGCLYPLKNAD